MPQQQRKQANPSNKKKKKGHAPAHQNTFAWKHNPKSKLTQKILESPNIHVCRRCHDKIEWRKQYRKYKPRTQPGRCNECQKRNVMAAYHTICESCTIHSAKAKEVVVLLLKQQQEPQSPQEGQDHNDQLPITTTATTTTTTTSSPEEDSFKPILTVEKPTRICAMCAKDVALPDPDDDVHDKEQQLLDSMGRIRLRERKAIERQLAKETKKKRVKGSIHDDDDEEETEAQNDEDDNDYNDGEEEEDDVENSADQGDDDPFLAAVGGADKLVTGEAYQRQLLERQKQQKQQENDPLQAQALSS